MPKHMIYGSKVFFKSFDSRRVQREIRNTDEYDQILFKTDIIPIQTSA